MNILVIDEELPYPLNSGKRLRTFNLLKYLAQWHKTTIICRPGQDYVATHKKLFENLGIAVHVVNHPFNKKSGVGFYLSLFVNLFSRLPYVVARHFSPGMVEEIMK